MGIRIENITILWDSVMGTPITPGYLCNKLQIVNYLKDHPFPDDQSYSKGDFIRDMQTTDNIVTFDQPLSKEIAEYIEEFIKEILL